MAGCSHSSAARAAKVVYHNLPKLLRIALTFLIVTIGWVFFRGGTLRGSVQYLGAMFHLNQPFPNASLIGGLIYKPYYVLSILAAGIVVWFGRQTWDWSQEMTWPKTATCFALGWARADRPGHAGIQSFYLFHFLAR